MPSFLPQVLEIPSAGGPTAPSPMPRAGALRELLVGRGIMGGGAANVPVPRLSVPFTSAQGGDCCPCPPGQQPLARRGQPPGTGFRDQPPGLGQPDRPQKPFQVPSGPCDPVEEALKRLGITPQMLKDCLRPGQLVPKKRKKRAASKKRATSKRKAMPKRRKSTKAKKKRVRAKGRNPLSTRRQRGQFVLLSNGACWNPRTRKFVKRSNCA